MNIPPFHRNFPLLKNLLAVCLLGFSTNFFEEVQTSGEMVWQAIALSLLKYGKNLKKCLKYLLKLP